MSSHSVTEHVEAIVEHVVLGGEALDRVGTVIMLTTTLIRINQVTHLRVITWHVPHAAPVSPGDDLSCSLDRALVALSVDGGRLVWDALRSVVDPEAVPLERTLTLWTSWGETALIVATFSLNDNWLCDRIVFFSVVPLVVSEVSSLCKCDVYD